MAQVVRIDSSSTYLDHVIAILRIRVLVEKQEPVVVQTQNIALARKQYIVPCSKSRQSYCLKPGVVPAQPQDYVITKKGTVLDQETRACPWSRIRCSSGNTIRCFCSNIRRCSCSQTGTVLFGHLSPAMTKLAVDADP